MILQAFSDGVWQGTTAIRELPIRIYKMTGAHVSLIYAWGLVL